MFKSIISAYLFLCLLFVHQTTFAQKGCVGINAGVTFDQGHTPLAASGEYFISNAFSLGLQGYYTQESVSTTSVIAGMSYSSFSKYTSTFVGLRGNFHLGTLLPADYQRFDPYVGVSAGKILLTGRQNINLGQYGQAAGQDSRSYDGITLYLPIGVRYLFTRTIGAFAEYNVGLANTTSDIDQNGKLDKFYEKRQYQLGVGISLRFW
jgi:hypothetical protein